MDVWRLYKLLEKELPGCRLRVLIESDYGIRIVCKGDCLEVPVTISAELLEDGVVGAVDLEEMVCGEIVRTVLAHK